MKKDLLHIIFSYKPVANKFRLITLLFLASFGFLNSQIYPVQVNSFFIPPYSTQLSDYSLSGENKFTLQLLLQDIHVNDRQVKLKLYIEGNGLKIQSNDFVIGASNIYLNGGIMQQYTNVDLRAYFQLQNLSGISPAQYSKPLPDGIYMFYWEVYDFITNQKISLKSGVPIYLLQNDPPFLNLPVKGENIEERNPINIIFQWTPRHVNATNVNYLFQLREIWDSQMNPQAAFLASPDYYTEETYSTTLLYNMSKPVLLPGKTYAWRVKAMSRSGLTENNIFKNNGYSEIYYFKYSSQCGSPTFPLSEALSPQTVKIHWQGLTAHNKYHIQYRKKSTSTTTTTKKGKEKSTTKTYEWFEIYTQNTQAQISNLEAGETYEFRIGGTCDPLSSLTQGYTYTGINEFTMPKKDEKSTYNCGISPNIKITNTSPLLNLAVNESFTAGDFTVTVKEISGQNGIYSGKGYIVVPYLADTKIAVEFNAIGVNTDNQLHQGKIETTYDMNWGEVVDVGEFIEDIFGPQTPGLNKPDPKNPEEVILEDPNNGLTPTNPEDSENPQEEKTEEESPNIPGEENPENPSEPEIPINPDNPSTPGEGQSETSETDASKEYFIQYLNKKYKTGDKINIPFKRDLSTTFEMVELSENTKVDWFFYKVGSKEVLNTSGSTKQKEMFELKKTPALRHKHFDLHTKANDLENKPEVKIEVLVKEKEFKLTNLIITDNSNSKRIAKNGETLYYINKTEKKKTNFKISYTPNLSIGEIDEERINWWYNDKQSLGDSGKNTIDRQISENKNIEVKVKAGYPTVSEKEGQVKWVGEIRQDASFGPPGINYLIEDFNKSLITPLKSITDKLNNYIGGNFKISINPIRMKGETYNEEDIESRHYHNILKGTINGGISLKGEFTGYPPILKPLNISGISSVGLYISPKVEFTLSGGVLKRKIGETNKELKNEFVLEGTLKGCIDAGLKTQLLVAKEYIEFEVRGYGSACSSGKVQYNMATEKFVGGIYLDPLKLGVKAKIASKGALDFTLVDIDKTWSITEKVKIYEYKK